MFINTTASLTCVAYGLPFPSITWNKNGTAVSNSSLTSIYEETKSENGVSFVRSVLEICGSDLTDSGEYSCTADNGITSDSSNFMITVVTVQGKNTFKYQCVIFQSVWYFFLRNHSVSRACDSC